MKYGIGAEDYRDCLHPESAMARLDSKYQSKGPNASLMHENIR